MPYTLRRPENATGEAPFRLYRAISRANQPLTQGPVRWVRSQPAFGPLSENPDPEHAALLDRVGTPNVAKVWTELAFEVVRVDIAPEHPSRLDSLYGFADPLEAFAFQEFVDSPVNVWEGDVTNGSRWGVVDMSRFSVVHPTASEPAPFAAAWEEASAMAHDYWKASGEINTAEILVDGSVQLLRCIRLLETLRKLGVVD